MFRNKSVDVHKFSMIPSASVPRSSFRIQKTHKTTFNSGLLIPVYVDEVLPGDSFNVNMTAFARLSTPLFPIMDNLHLDSFFFFVPNRLVWDNWKKFMGEQTNPGDSTSYSVPQATSPAGGYAVCSLQDYMGLPTVGQLTAGQSVAHNNLFMRAYNLIWNEWFRDENLQNSRPVPHDDGPDDPTQFTLLRRGKRHDYFTACLPWPQKGQSVSLPLGTSAPVYSTGQVIRMAANTAPTDLRNINAGAVPAVTYAGAGITGTPGFTFGPNGQNITSMYADLSAATAATINQLRQSFQIQKLLERDARGGTRYTEIVRSHFGVISPDARLQRPEYLGGGSTPVNINPVAQSSATGISGGTTPTGTLAGVGTAVASHGFRQSFTEHGMVIGMVQVRADLTYQQGLRKMWSRKTRYDFYWPAFAMLGEQAVLNKEIYVTGTPAQDDAVFGYQERWAEYRHNPSRISGLFKSTSAGTIDAWHLAQKFTALPTLGATFIEDTPPVQRVVAVGAAANGQEFIFDSFFNVVAARPLPMYSVPGLIDHF